MRGNKERALAADKKLVEQNPELLKMRDVELRIKEEKRLAREERKRAEEEQDEDEDEEMDISEAEESEEEEEEPQTILLKNKRRNKVKF